MSGKISPIMLYKALYMHRNAGEVLVLDDIDVWTDEDAMNVLKAGLDTSRTRTITWATSSRELREEDIPNNFDFNGAVVFITNYNLDRLCESKTKMAEHAKALLSRVLYVDLCIHTLREIMIRIEQVIEKTDILVNKNISNAQKKDVVQWVRDNHKKFRNLSLRAILHLADMVVVDPKNWTEMAEHTLFDPRKI
jgi:hypothetical protein